MNQIDFKKLIPYVTAIVLFLLVTFLYFNPLFSGKRINQSDIVAYKGMSKEIADFRNKTGDEALWTNSMFGGMPAYQISIRHSENLLEYIHETLQFGMPRPAGTVMLYFLGFFLLLLILGVNPWLSIIGAIAFGFSSYFMIIFEPGHNTKAIAIAYMAPVLAGIILTFKGRILWGTLLTAIFLGLEIKANHLQMTYYLLLIVIIYGIFELIHAYKQTKLLDFSKKIGILLIAVVFAVLANITSLWTTYEYSKETIRGKSELRLDQNNQTSGLDKDYATQWSYGVAETFSLMIPNIKGGSSGYLANETKALENVDREVRDYVKQQSRYWGDQPFINGPVYVGAIIIFFFILGMFILKGRFKWMLFTATILSITLAWGKNFMPLTELFLDYFPLYNKFRAVSMMLVVAEFCIPIVAILTINEIIKKPEIIKENLKYFWIASGATAGLSILFYLLPTTFFSFFSQLEIAALDQYKNDPNYNQIQLIFAGMETARLSIFKADVMRSIAFIVLGIITTWFFATKKLKVVYFMLIIGALIAADLISVSYRYLNNDDYVRKARMEKPIQLSTADRQILQDQSLDYRVLNLSGDSFQEAYTSYYHKSTGGYHGAKLRRYQELITHHMRNEMEQLIGVLSKPSTPEAVTGALRNLKTINMLNTKYLILDPSRMPLMNPYASGNAWFVKDIVWVEDANEEIQILSQYDLTTSVVIDKRFKDQFMSTRPASDSLASIQLTTYEPNHLTYQSSSNAAQLAVFSEIYYKNGWNAYIDGEKVAHARANYVLRALEIPAGSHLIEFRFEPGSYFIGKKISFISSLFMILLLLGAIGLEVKKIVQK
ncbi:MAG: hypothetical protein DRI84_08515 [Bacteroidetes bacterium]|nr:MAG: hypothetical protein DRI84_08515 [Bacteroidota bacterium]